MLFVIVLTVCLFSPFSVKAEGSISCNDFKNNIKDVYGFSVIPDVESSTPKITISMNIAANVLNSITGLKNNKPTFKVSRIFISSGKMIDSYSTFLEEEESLTKLADYNTEEDLNANFNGLGSKELKDGSSIIIPNNRTDDVIYYIILESVSPDYVLQKKCDTESNSIVFLALSAPIKPVYVVDDRILPIGDDDYDGEYGVLDCNKSFPTGSFEDSFCKVWNAVENPRVFTKDKRVNGENDIDKYWCDAFKSLPSELAKLDSSEKDNYYKSINRKYLAGTISYDKPIDYYYVYNYGGQNPSTHQSVSSSYQTKEEVKCKVTCREVVTVEYGLPVASVAGMCFEYKVQVTSRVNCDSEITNPPQIVKEYCTPTPYCVNLATGFTNTDAGPSEEFDSCIKACDGGKYTSGCSRQCYNSVYGFSSNLQKNKYLDFKEVVEKLNIPQGNCAFQGYYYSTGSIYWSPFNCLARWYQSHGHHYNCIASAGGGIDAECNCAMICQWVGCNGGNHTYLNPDEGYNDYLKNKEIYEKAKSACKQGATCSTTQATFTISANYNYTGEGDGVWINFPYDKNQSNVKDKISGDAKTCTARDVNTTTILNRAGCYSCESYSPGNMYFTEWGFPGSWIRNKTGAVSYDYNDVGNSKYWTPVPKKFCLPLDTKNVNAKWWNAYYLDKAKQNPSLNFSYNDSDYMNNIADDCDKFTCKTTTKNFDEGDEITYNIHAETRKFGMFEWNIDMNCFYATNDNFPNYGTSQTTCEKSRDGCSSNSRVEPYTIHSVDLAKLFPAKNTDEARSPGFNWSQFSAVTEKTNPYYTSSPARYAKWVQENNYAVYNENYLDYEIELKKENIKALKKSRDYTDFDEDGFTLNSQQRVLHYRSPLFTGDGEIDLSSATYPNYETLKCNNIANVSKNGSNYEVGCFYVEREVNK